MAHEIKRVGIDQLRPGMYVHDLNCGWLDHPFVTNRFKIGDQEAINKIRALGVKELYIDTSRGMDVSDAPAREQIQAELQRHLERVGERPSAAAHSASVHEERDYAADVQREASRVVTTLMQDVRLGKQIETERVNHVVDNMVSSIFRNPHALLSLGRIRRMDRYTFEHSVSVGALMISFAKELQLERAVIQEIGVGALLHDIGKLQVPDHILNKPGRLTDDEFVIMRRHVEYSRELLEQTGEVSPTAIAVAAQHHERYDGSGYPDKLRGGEISPYGQMAAIADVYDAISADRCYHKGEPPTTVLRRLLEWSKFHFSERLVHQFIRCVGIYPVGTLVRLESGRLGVVMEPGEHDPLHPVVRVVYDAHKGCYIMTRDIDLAHGSDDRIVGPEAPERWGIKVDVIMDSVL